MESLVAWVKVTQKKRLRVVELDADRSPELAHHLGVRETPTLLVLRAGAVVDRLEGRATGRQIDQLIRPYLGVDRRPPPEVTVRRGRPPWSLELRHRPSRPG